MTTGGFQLTDFLGGAPEETYFSFQDRFQGRGGGTQKRYFQSSFNDILKQFRGNLGQSIKSMFPQEGGGQLSFEDLTQQQLGQLPTFNRFLENFDFNQAFGRIAPSVRGATTARFAPTTRFMNF